VNWRRAVATVLVLWAAWEVARSLTRLDGVVFTGYTQVGEVVLQGGDPYGLPINTWPPFFLFLAAVLALLARVSLPGALLLWQLGSVATIWGSCRLMSRLVGEEPAPVASTAVLVPLLMTTRLLQEHLQHTQINLYLLFLILLAFHLFRRRREPLGGLVLATATSLRAVPLLFLPYLLYKRAWRAAAWTTAFLLVLNIVLPLVLFGPAMTAERWTSWRTRAAVETSDPTPVYPNQSLLSALKRLLTAEGGARDPLRYNIASWPTARVVRLFYVLVAVGLIALAFAFRRHPRGEGLADPSAFGEVAVVLCLMTLISPLAWKAHYVTVLAGYWLIWRVIRGQQRQWPWVLWWASFICLTLTAPALIGGHLRAQLESLNVITVGALLVLVLVVWATLLRQQPPTSAVEPSRP
jgi:glycosyl transferase family 87